MRRGGAEHGSHRTSLSTAGPAERRAAMASWKNSSQPASRGTWASRAWRFSALICVVLLIASARSARAGINVWTTHGPEGGSVRALALDPTVPTALYAAGGGVFRLSNAAPGMDHGHHVDAVRRGSRHNTSRHTSPPPAEPVRRASIRHIGDIQGEPRAKTPSADRLVEPRRSHAPIARKSNTDSAARERRRTS